MNIKQFKLNARMNNYFERNGKLSPLNQLEYLFLKNLYWFLTKQVMREEDKENLYDLYTRLINVCYFPNREEINKEMVDTIYLQCMNLLYREHQSNYTFIILNKESHHQKMRNALELLRNWAFNDDKGNYLDEKEFNENMEFIRKQFNNDTIDIHYQTGKWPKKLRKRFNRERGS